MDLRNVCYYKNSLYFPSTLENVAINLLDECSWNESLLTIMRLYNSCMILEESPPLKEWDEDTIFKLKSNKNKAMPFIKKYIQYYMIFFMFCQ